MSQDLVARALSSLRNRDFVAARQCIVHFAEENPLELQHYLIRGLSDIALKDWLAAVATFSEASRVFPHQPQIWFNLGVAQENLAQFHEAAESYEHSLDLQPQQPEACGNLSNVYRRLGWFEEAEAMAHRAYEGGADKATALNSLGLALARQGKTEAAEKIFQQVLNIAPAHSHALLNLANVAVDRLDLATAWPLYAAARAVDSSPVFRQEEALARLLAGDFATGWPLYESRLEIPTALRVKPNAPLWHGEPLVGKKLLLVSEQGFGDTIQFCRYGIPLSQQGVALTWVVPQALHRLLAANLPGDVLAEGSDIPPVDYYIPLMSLPLVMQRLMPAEAPAAPYLLASNKPLLPGAKKDKQKIGVVWSASPTAERGAEKSVSLSLFAPLWKMKDAQFFSPSLNSVGRESEDLPVRRLDKLITDFADTAALLAQMDVVITVDTAVAHLAGALGITTYVLLPYCPDWRWGVTGTNTPFYRSLILLRQPVPGDWGSVVAAVMHAITQP
jgi:Flp pilus assembly protein TadD